MEKIKILHFFGKMDMGGAETFVMNVYRNIDRQKFQFDFLVSSSEKGHYDDEITLLGGQIYIITSPEKISDIRKYQHELKKVMLDNKYDVVHSHVHFFSGEITSIAKKTGVKNIISHSHSSSDGKKDSLPRYIYRKYMRCLIIKNSTYLLGCSKQARESLFGNINDNRIIQINNAIDIKRFKEIKQTRDDVLGEFGISKDSYVIGHIGRFDEVKNHSFIIDVFYEVLKKKQDSYLILVGEGILQDDIRKKVNDLKINKNVIFAGLREDIPELLNSFDAFLFPSLYEGLSVVLVEAQATGIPCFISDTITKENDMGTENIKFIPLENTPVYWSDSILNSKSERNLEGYKRVIENGYSIESTVEKIEKIYINSDINTEKRKE